MPPPTDFELLSDADADAPAANEMSEHRDTALLPVYPAWFTPKRTLALFVCISMLVYMDRGVRSCPWLRCAVLWYLTPPVLARVRPRSWRPPA
jgi:hypothetical protein